MRSDGARWLKALGLPDEDRVGEPSRSRFLDGASARFEIPSVEGPEVLEAVLEEVRRLDCPLHRVSQGSGIAMLTDAEIARMAQMGRDAGIEVSLFVGPRAGWATGAMHLAPNGGVVRPRLRGMTQLRAALDDVARAHALGIRSVLVADDGLLALLPRLKAEGLWPADMAVKVSVMMGAANPVAIAHWAAQGIATYNVPTDLTLAELATVRSVTPIPLDVYVEAPDDVGGFVRYEEMAAMVEYLAPVYLKFGVRNAPGMYPSGRHLARVAVELGRERARRARLAYERLVRAGLADRLSPVPCTAPDLARPVPGGG